MEKLFAPWRLSYLKEKSSHSGCVFCALEQTPEKDESNFVLERAQYSYVVLNRYPYSNGHLMLVPYRHTADWVSLNSDELLEMGQLSQKALKHLGAIAGAQGFNMGINLGKAAGAGIQEHLHYHIVPRWEGDTNFMPLLSEVRVIAEHLEETFKRLKEVWD